jgi:hypothetical protein
MISTDSYRSGGIELIHYAWEQLFHGLDGVTKKRVNMRALGNAFAKCRLAREFIPLDDEDAREEF